MKPELPRLTADTMAPGLFMFILNLSIATCIDKRAFVAWADHNRLTLVFAFGLERLPDIYFRGWAMEQFANRAVAA
jgi:hypothetical protein